MKILTIHSAWRSSNPFSGQTDILYGDGNAAEKVAMELQQTC